MSNGVFDTSLLGKEVILLAAVFSATDRFEKGAFARVICKGKRADGTTFVDLRAADGTEISEVATEKVMLAETYSARRRRVTQADYQTDPKWAAKL